MKGSVVLFFLFFLTIQFVRGQVCDGEKVFVIENGSCNYNDWELVFEDTFDGAKLDDTKWLNALPWGRHLQSGFNGSLEYPTDGKNFEFSNGILKIAVRPDSIYAKGIEYLDSNFVFDDGLLNLRWWPYTSGLIFCKEQFGYGKYEMRCKLPKGKGLWSAFWLFGQVGDTRSEIDIFEFWNQDNMFGNFDPKKLSVEHHMTLHYKDQMCETNYIGADFSAQFHTFTMEWDNYKIEWYVDGVLKRRSTKFYTLLGQVVDCNSIKANEPYILNRDYPMKSMLNIIVSLGVQSGKNAPDETVAFPSYLNIDYIRYYKKRD